MTPDAFRLAIIIMVAIVLAAGAALALLAAVAQRRAWREFSAHRRSVLEEQEEVRRRGEDIERWINRGGRP